MSPSWVIFKNVSFSYQTAGDPLLSDLSLHFPTGWTGIVGASGAGKTTLLRLATADIEPQQGQILITGKTAYCPQRTDNPPEDAASFLDDPDGDSRKLRGRLAIGSDWDKRWSSLSPGERKRFQIGAALWLRPEVLALDEPTNHIDAHARDLLAAALKTYRGVGLLVSHDRELLDDVCQQCFFVDPPNVVVRSGNYSEAVRQAKLEEDHRQKERKIAKATYARLKRTVKKRREVAAKADRRRSKSSLAPKDHDGRAKKDLSRVTGKDGQAGRLLQQLAGRVKQAKQKLQQTRTKKVHQLGIWVSGERSRRDHLVRLCAGEIPLGKKRSLRFPDLVLSTDARIALTGPNGSGKTTLIRHITKHVNLAPRKLTYLPQEIDINASRRLIKEVRSLPRDQLTRAMTVISRLNSRPERLLESSSPSPGETRKLLLALGIAHGPHFIVMDEPTNHLDLPSIECLERALAGCPCALLLASHDKRFLERLTQTHWRIAPGENATRLLISVP